MMNKSRLIQAGVAVALTAGLAVAAQAQQLPSPLNYGTGNGAPGDAIATGGALIGLSGSGNSYTFTLSGSLGSNAELTLPSKNTSLTGATITLTGTLSRTGSNPWVLTSGTETISGSIAACSSNCGASGLTWGAGSGTLFKANLSNMVAYQGSGGSDYLGFNSSFSGTSSWMLTNNINQGSMNESVYLYALSSTALSTSVQNNPYFNAFVAALASGANLSSGTVNAYLGSYSTVPLPLSAWLMGGGLLGLGAFARRKAPALG
jgi:hypothetical protein